MEVGSAISADGAASDERPKKCVEIQGAGDEESEKGNVKGDSRTEEEEPVTMGEITAAGDTFVNLPLVIIYMLVSS